MNWPIDAKHLWHRTAVIGDPPEHRDWHRGDRMHRPQIGEGTRIRAYVTVDSGIERTTQVGKRCFLLAKSHVGHDAVLGDEVELSTGAIVGGHAEVGDRVRIGLNAVILPFRKIGAGARIGAGAVVTHDVPEGEIWAGVPARRLDSGSPFREPKGEGIP